MLEDKAKAAAKKHQKVQAKKYRNVASDPEDQTGKAKQAEGSTSVSWDVKIASKLN